MALIAYIRVSSEKQSYDRQKLELVNYFRAHGINTDGIQYVQEKITSYTSFKERAIYSILKNGKPGDIVYVCQLDRLGRTVEDIIHLVKFADGKGVELQTADGFRVTYTTPQGKMMLTLLAMVAEMERELRAERCQSGTDAAIKEIEVNGFRIARKSGKIQTRWGNEKGTDETKRIMAIARDARSRACQDAKILWREQSKGFAWVRAQLAKGKSRALILGEFNELHEVNPEDFSTREGKPLSKGVLSKWCAQMPPLDF